MAEWKVDLASETYDIYLWLVQRHILPFFAHHKPSQVGWILDEAVERELDHPALWIGEPDSVRCGSA